MFIVGLLPIAAMTLEDHYVGKKTIMDSEKGHLSYALNSRLDFLQAWLSHIRKEFLSTVRSDCSTGKCSGEIKNEGQQYPVCGGLDTVNNGYGIYNLLVLYDRDWNPLVTTTKFMNRKIDRPSPEFRALISSSSGLVHDEVFMSPGGHPLLPLARATYTEEGKIYGYVVGHLNLALSLSNILGDSSGIGETGRFYILDSRGKYLWTPNDQREKLGTTSSLPPTIYRSPPTGVLNYHDERGREVLGVSARASEELPWILLAQVETPEAYSLLYREIFLSTLTGLLTLFAVSFISIKTYKKLAAPLSQLAGVARNISQGNIKERAPEFTHQETREVGEAFNSMMDRLEAGRRTLVNNASLAAIGELSSSIVHEMRTPLSSVKMNLQALEKHVQSSPVYAEMALIAVQQTNRLELMLSDLLQHGKPLDLHLTETRFKHLAENAINSGSQPAQKKGIHVEVEDDLEGQELYMDSEKIVRTLTNLVDNAVFWTPPGGRVRLTGARIEAQPGWIAISVLDQGPGIPPEQIDKVFNLFFSTRRDGIGIGLANVKKIVEYHGGRVFCMNMAEGGAMFVFELPARGPEL